MNTFIQCCGAFILTTAKTNDRWFRSLVKVLKLHVVKDDLSFLFGSCQDISEAKTSSYTVSTKRIMHIENLKSHVAHLPKHLGFLQKAFRIVAAPRNGDRFDTRGFSHLDIKNSISYHDRLCRVKLIV